LRVLAEIQIEQRVMLRPLLRRSEFGATQELVEARSVAQRDVQRTRRTRMKTLHEERAQGIAECERDASERGPGDDVGERGRVAGFDVAIDEVAIDVRSERCAGRVAEGAPGGRDRERRFVQPELVTGDDDTQSLEDVWSREQAIHGDPEEDLHSRRILREEGERIEGVVEPAALDRFEHFRVVRVREGLVRFPATRDTVDRGPRGQAAQQKALEHVLRSKVLRQHRACLVRGDLAERHRVSTPSPNSGPEDGSPSEGGGSQKVASFHEHMLPAGDGSTVVGPLCC
jgi:hypothetical protein